MSTGIESAMNVLIQSKLDQIIQKHSLNEEINVDTLKELCKFNSNEISRIMSTTFRPSNRIKRPQSGYFVYLNKNRDKITEIINADNKQTWLDTNSSIPDDGSKPWALKGKDKVTLVTKWAGNNWKNIMTEEEKQPYLEKAAILKQEYDLAKQNCTDNFTSEPFVKRGRGRPKGSKNKKTKHMELEDSNISIPSITPSPSIEPNTNEEEDEIVKVTKFNFEDKDYLLDSKSGDVYNSSTQDIIGKYDGSTIVFN